MTRNASLRLRLPETAAMTATTTATIEDFVHERLIARRAEMLAYFRRRLGTREDAEDALQDMIVKAIRAARTLGSRDSADAWIGRVMRNTLFDHYRRAATRRVGDAAFGRDLANLETRGAVPDEPPSCRCVHSAIADLRGEQAELIRRIDLGEEARLRVAEDLGMTLNALGVRLHRARKSLKDRITENCPTCAKGEFRLCDCAHADATVAAHAGASGAWL